MSHGFTLFEILFFITLLAILSVMTVPSLESANEQMVMQRFISELDNFFILAKSEATLNKQPLWVEIQHHHPQAWRLTLSRRPPASSSLGVILQEVQQKNYPLIQLHATWQQLQIRVTGKPLNAGRLTFYIQENKQMRLIFHNVTGRFRFCGVGGAYYAYPQC